MSASEDSIFTRPFASMLFNVVRADPPYCYRCPIGLQWPSCQVACLGERQSGEGTALLGTLLEQHQGRVAAVLVEPMLQAAGGMVVWPAEYLAGVRRLCDRHGVLMIADEVLTGFGRTGRMFACEHAQVSPDIICLSKALTGGYMPLGATVSTEAVYDAFLSRDRTRTFFHGHSFTANPLACAVALASLDLIEETRAIAKVQLIEGWLREGLEPLGARRYVGDVRVIGGVGIVELVSDKETKSAGGYLDDIGPRLTAAFLKRNLLLRPLGNVLYVMPPYVITEDETRWVVAQIADALEECVGS
jgi:adenosylmethionine-8-amino-7-oxononanoate aminotransferase